jgi:antirestriction protein ArdC
MTTKSAERLPAAARVTAQITQLLERGVRPWRQPWDFAQAGGVLLPRRANGERYRGMNVIALWAAAADAGFASPYWFTFKQALALGAQVRKGEHGAFVIFYKPVAAERAAPENPNVDAEAEARRSVLRGYVVFNRAQIDGLDHRFDPPAPQACSEDAFAPAFAKVGASIRHGGARAFYAPSTDHVQMPPMAAFAGVSHYYATLAHELGHWTRHPSRLNRAFGAKRFADHGYALEELVAEMCAAFVGAELGLPPDHIENHAAYVASWLAVLKQNPGAFLTAAGKAQLAADYLLRLMGESRGREAPDK